MIVIIILILILIVLIVITIIIIMIIIILIVITAINITWMMLRMPRSGYSGMSSLLKVSFDAILPARNSSLVKRLYMACA